MTAAEAIRPESLDALRAIAAVPSAARRSALNDLHDSLVQALDALETLRSSTAISRSRLVADELDNMEADTTATLDSLRFVASLLTPDDEQDRNDAAIDRAMAVRS